MSHCTYPNCSCFDDIEEGDEPELNESGVPLICPEETQKIPPPSVPAYDRPGVFGEKL